MKVTIGIGAILVFASVLSLTENSWAQASLETTGGGRDSSETAGTRDVGPVKMRRLPNGGTELEIPADANPQLGRRDQLNQSEREALRDVELDKKDRVVVEPQNQRYSTSPPGSAGMSVTPDNQWRYRYYGHQWWYWQPNNTWAYYFGNQWVPYNPDSNGQYYPKAATAANMGPRARFYADQAVPVAPSGPRRYQSAYRGYNGSPARYPGYYSNPQSSPNANSRRAPSGASERNGGGEAFAPRSP